MRTAYDLGLAHALWACMYLLGVATVVLVLIVWALAIGYLARFTIDQIRPRIDVLRNRPSS